jgi:hypothetical protein
MMRNKGALKTTMISERVSAYVMKNKSQVGSEGGLTLHAKYEEAKSLVLDDEFWAFVEGVVALMSPTLGVLRAGDSDKPTASKVHYMQYEVCIICAR